MVPVAVGVGSLVKLWQAPGFLILGEHSMDTPPPSLLADYGITIVREYGQRNEGERSDPCGAVARRRNRPCAGR